jgi:guanylate kinase
MRQRDPNLTDAEVSERLEIARQEMEEDAPQYDMIIENEDGKLKEAIERVVEIVRKEGYNLGTHV